MKITFRIFAFTLILLVAFGCVFKDKLKRIQFARKMFSGVEQVERFRSIEAYFPTRVIAASENPSPLQRGRLISLPETYEFEGTERKTKQLLEETDVTGLMVLKNDSILFEQYYRGNTVESHTIGWSVTKSFVSALMGIAIEEGFVRSIHEKTSDYLPELIGTAYENVTIKNLLQMSSGVSWNEDYSDKNSDINRFGRTLALGRSFESFVKTLSRDKEQGTFNRYNSSDTQVLGMIIARATGKSLSEYLEEMLWKPLGMENKAWWLLDDQGNEFAAAGLSASLRDYARFGLLYLNEGNWNGTQIIPKEWIKQSITPDAPHLTPGKNELSNNEFGYGYQWWVFDGSEGEYAALGIYNQMIYVNPTHNIIVVKSSANNKYGTTNDESSFREKETIAMLRQFVMDISEHEEQEDDFTVKIDSVIQTTNPRKFNGVVLITKKGETKYSKAYGYSNFEDKTPININDNFRIQSNSKQITAVLILKEVEKGKIDLERPIKTYLPDFNQSWADTVTVHQLLNMSAGIVDFDKPLAFKPGTGFRYSNPAYGLLGRIFESVTGKSYVDVANAMFMELGMKNTYCYEMDKPSEGLINGYRNSGEEYSLLPFGHFGFTEENWKDFIPAGGIISNVHDLNNWDIKLHNGEILKPSTYNTMISSDVPDSDKAFSSEPIVYGYGVNINKNKPIKYIGHAGRGMGFTSLKFYIFEKNVDVIILENVYNANTDIIYHFEKEIRDIVLKSKLIQ